MKTVLIVHRHMRCNNIDYVTGSGKVNAELET